MKYSLIQWCGLLLLLSTNLLPSPALASDITELALPNICAAELVDGTSEACNAFVSCAANAGETESCTPDLYQSMLGLCETLACERDALLTISTILVATDYHIEREDTGQVERTLGTALLDYQTGEFYAARDKYSSIFDEYQHRLLPYSMALISENTPDNGSILGNYQRALNVQFDTPLVFYSRAQFYIGFQEPELAMRDLLTFIELQSEDFDLTNYLLMPDNLEPFTFTTNFTRVAYDLVTAIDSPGGVLYYDNGRVPGYEIQYDWFDTVATLAIRGLFQNTDMTFYHYPETVFMGCDPDANCALDLPLQRTIFGISPGGTRLELRAGNENMELISTFLGGESSSRSYTILLSASEPDPRTPIVCENGVHPLARVGDTVYGSPYLNGNIPIYASPDVNSERLAEATQAVVIEEMICGEDGGNWWQIVGIVDDTQVIGWTYEAVDTLYYLLPERFYRNATPTFDQLLGIE